MLIHHLKSANVISKNLDTLYLSLNYIDDEGVIAFTECLPELFPRLDNFHFGYHLDRGGSRKIERGGLVRKSRKGQSPVYEGGGAA